jgi:hypothetical protein
MRPPSGATLLSRLKTKVDFLDHTSHRIKLVGGRHRLPIDRELVLANHVFKLDANQPAEDGVELLKVEHRGIRLKFAKSHNC